MAGAGSVEEGEGGEIVAEFPDVIEQFDRMCWYYQRKRECPMACPMNGVNISQCRKVAFEKPKETEEIVMKWAAEHPEPVYPTWVEWLLSKGILIDKSSSERFPNWIPSFTAYDQIPADIAQKLGIEPKEGV